jgi:hypothetical protein
MNKEFVMRGQTASGGTEVLNFSGNTPGYAYRLTEFTIYPSTNIGGELTELCGTVTAGKTAVAPTDPNFNNEGLIGTALMTLYSSPAYPASSTSVVNDTFLITQDLILMVQDTDASGTQYPINWQCRFVAEKMNDAETAVTNYRQFQISDE